MILRDYQRDALNAVSTLVQSGARRLIVALPTGGGKTIVFSHLAETLGLAPDQKVLILAHRDELVQQAVDKYLAVNPGEMIGIEKASKKATPFDRVCVASVQTLQGNRLGEFLARWGYPALIVTDEAHHAVGPNYRDIYDACGVTANGSTIHVGVTATPKRADKVGLDGTFDVVAYSIGIGDLVKRGHLVSLVGYRVTTNVDLDKVRVVAGEFNQGDLGAAVNTPQRNARVVQAYQDITPNRKALVFAATVAHSKDLASTFKHAGYRAEHLDGATPAADRRKILADFASGEIEVLCNCAVLTEGYDEPSLEVVIIARPTKSTVLYAQMIGRATRLHPGKAKAAVIDMVDASRKHSVVSLPSLLGLPPSFNLGGRDATAMAERWERLANQNPDAAALINDAQTLMRLDKTPTGDEMAVVVKKLMAEAKASSTYIPIDLFRTPALPPDMAGLTHMTWVPAGDDSFRLRIRNAVITITGNLVGLYRVLVRHKSGVSTDLGTHRGHRDAFTAAEAWVRSSRGEELNFLDKRVSWRQKPAQQAQLDFLRRHRVKFDPKITRGEASSAIDLIVEAVGKGRA
jgi:superfamily II DNA or RNA helicase